MLQKRAEQPKKNYLRLKSKLKPEVKLHLGYIIQYEIGDRMLPLLVLLGHSRLAGVRLEMLIDDDIKLPEILPLKRNGNYKIYL